MRETLSWYFGKVYGRLEGPGVLPFYCDPKRVGHFAVSPSELAAGRSPALFKLFVGMAMFQARSDVLIMRQQAAMAADDAQQVLSTKVIGQLVARSYCDLLRSAANFDAVCNVHKAENLIDCAYRPGTPCANRGAAWRTLTREIGETLGILVIEQKAAIAEWHARGAQVGLAKFASALSKT